MLLGLGIVPVRLAVRAGLPDIAVALRGARDGAKPFGAVRIGGLVVAVLVIASGTVPFAIGGIMTSCAIAAPGLPLHIAFLAAVVLGGATVAAAPLGGWPADRVGWRPTIAASRLALAAASWPLFAWTVRAHGNGALLAASCALAVMSTTGTPSTLCLVAHAMPLRSRAAGLSIVDALGVSLFGSATRPSATALLAATGDPRPRRRGGRGSRERSAPLLGTAAPPRSFGVRRHGASARVRRTAAVSRGRSGDSDMVERFDATPEPRPEPDPATVERAAKAMAALLADLPTTRPWTRRPTPASRPSAPA